MFKSILVYPRQTDLFIFKNKKGLANARPFFQRRVRDSNPRYLSVQQFSRLPQSTTLPTLRDKSSNTLNTDKGKTEKK